jgi:hypothetical protein
LAPSCFIPASISGIRTGMDLVVDSGMGGSVRSGRRCSKAVAFVDQGVKYSSVTELLQ